MSCNDSELLRINFPKTIIAMWISSTETSQEQTNSHITNDPTGYLVELEALGQSASQPGSKSLTASPYSIRLRPLTRLSAIYQAGDVLLKDIEFVGYDTTLTGSSFQDAATIAEIYGSKATDDAYAQSIYKNGLINNWQPNFLRPEMYIDGRNVLEFLADNNFDGLNKGDLSFGIPIGRCFDLSIYLSKVREINVFAQLAQYISGTGLFQRYPVLCTATFWVK